MTYSAVPRAFVLVSVCCVIGCGGGDERTSAEANPTSATPARAVAPVAPPSFTPNVHARPATDLDPDTKGSADQTTEDPAEAASGESPADAEVGQRLGSCFSAWSQQGKQHFSGSRGREEDGSVNSQFSWLVEILPFIGHQEIYDEIDFDKPWTKGDNIKAAIQVIPTFQNPLDDRRRWEGYPFEGLALSHFAGISGVERKRTDVAANYPRDHQDAGIFGYDEVMRADQVTDGTSHTLAIIGSGELAGPWIQAGGATVRGARQPYFDEITGLGSRGLSRNGAAAIAADGSARFIASDIDPQVFAALCTAHGSEPIAELETYLQAAEPVPADKRIRFRHTELAD